MKKQFLEFLNRSKKVTMIFGMYVLLAAGVSLGMVGCSNEETAKAETKQEDTVKNDAEETESMEVSEDEVKVETGGDVDIDAKDTEETEVTVPDEKVDTTSTQTVKKTTEQKSNSKKKSNKVNTSSSNKDNTVNTEKSEHSHKWTAVYKEVDNGSYEKQLVKAAWTEEVPQYTMVWVTRCNGCGIVLTDSNHITEHTKSQGLLGNFACGGWTTR